jgi:hypothetical protein
MAARLTGPPERYCADAQTPDWRLYGQAASNFRLETLKMQGRSTKFAEYARALRSASR